MAEIIRKTRSVCPVCMDNLPADLIRTEDGCLYLEKCCPEHGMFRTVVWKGKIDFENWILGAEPLKETEGLHCPHHCGICAEHETGTCCTLLEVTKRCNLKCRFCFAKSGSSDQDPTFEDLKAAVDGIILKCGHPLIQFSGGEPTLWDDLPDLIRYAAMNGCSTQINTNGLRLAGDPSYVKALKDAGLNIVFLQFDGTKEEIYQALRGKALLDQKMKAIRNCSENRIGVTLVPTVVKGINDDDLGALIRLAVSLSPAVRGIHFQPVSYFGRYPDLPKQEDRYTLDDLISDITEQSGISPESFVPSRCDHPLCGFHGAFLPASDGRLEPLSSVTYSSRTKGCAKENREYVLRHWSRADEEKKPKTGFSDEMDFDTFLYRLRHETLTLSAMAFQDAMNLNIERLRQCSLHVYDKGKIRPFCSMYLTPVSFKKP